MAGVRHDECDTMRVAGLVLGGHECTRRGAWVNWQNLGTFSFFSVKYPSTIFYARSSGLGRPGLAMNVCHGYTGFER